MRRPLALLAIALLPAVAAAQEATPSPVETLVLPLEPAPAPTLVTVNGAPAVVVPAPSEASPAEVQAVGERSAETLEDVASGDVTIAEATRDPVDAPDPGAGSLFWVLALVFGSVVRPITDAVISRLPRVDDKLAGAINTAALIAMYVGAWSMLAGSNPGLPQDAVSWVIAGFAAAGLGSATNSGLRTMSAAKS